MTVEELIYFINKDPSILNYSTYIQMPKNSSCMKYDIDGLEQIAVDRDNKKIILIPDYCLDNGDWVRSDNNILNKPSLESESCYWQIYEIDDRYYEDRKELKKEKDIDDN